MITIHKYKMLIEGTCSLELMLPIGADIVHIGQQFNVVCLWAIIDTEKDLEPVIFHVFCTGDPIQLRKTCEMKYKATVQVDRVKLDGCRLVVHIFKET